MKKPYVVAHALSTIDGRIQVHNWPRINTGDLFESAAETFKSDAWIVGRKTMQEFSSKKAHRLGKSDPSMFDAEEGHTSRKAKALQLKSIKHLPGGVLWIRYQVRN